MSYLGRPLAALSYVLTEEERGLLGRNDITYCEDLQEQTRDPESRLLLSRRIGLPVERLLLVGALARCEILAMPGADAIRTWVKKQGLPEQNLAANTGLQEALLGWDPSLLIEHFGDFGEDAGVLRDQLKAGALATLHLALVFGAVLAVLLLAAAWSMRGGLFGKPAQDLLGAAVNARLRADALISLRLLAGVAGIVLLTLTAFGLGQDVLTSLLHLLQMRLLRVRGRMALADLEALLPVKRPRLAWWQNKPVATVIGGIGIVVMVVLILMGHSEPEQIGLFVAATVGLSFGVVIVLGIVTQWQAFSLQPAGWVAGVRTRWAQIQVFRALIIGTFLLGYATVLLPWMARTIDWWSSVAQAPHAAVNAVVFERRLDDLGLPPDEVVQWQGWSEQRKQMLVADLARLGGSGAAIWEQARWPLIFVLIASIALLVLGQWALAQSGRGAVFVLLWLAAYVMVQYGPGWLRGWVPVPEEAAYWGFMIFVVALPFIVTVVSDAFFAHLETGCTQECPSCGLPMGTGMAICDGCGKAIA